MCIAPFGGVTSLHPVYDVISSQFQKFASLGVTGIDVLLLGGIFCTHPKINQI